jgi:hypothetical protein
MGPVTHDVIQGTVDSYNHIIAANGVAFYDFVRKTAGNPGPLHQAAETAAEDLKTEIIHIIETTHLSEAPARPSPDQTFASVQGGSTPATAAAAPAQCSTVGLTSARQHRFAQAATAACSAGTTRRRPVRTDLFADSSPTQTGPATPFLSGQIFDNLLQSVRNLPTVSHAADGSGNMLFRFEAAIKEFCEVFVDPLLEQACRSSYGNREVLTAEQTTLRDTAARFRKVLAALADTINSNDSSLSAEQELQTFLYQENLSQQSMSSAGLSPDSPQISSSVRKSVSLQKQIELQASTRKNIQHVICSIISVYWQLTPVVQGPGRTHFFTTDLSKFTGALRPVMLLDESPVSARTAQLLEAAICAYLSANVDTLHPVIPFIMRLIEEKDCGDGRTLPITLHEVTANPYLMDSVMSPLYQSNYKAANHALYRILARFCEKGVNQLMRPHNCGGRGSQSKMIQADNGDGVAVIAIWLCRHIQSTYTDRIQFQEYFLQASTKLQKVRNPVEFMRTLQKSMSHAMRLKTLLPYESVVAFAYALRERCSAYNEIAGEVISLSDADIKAQGLTDNGLPALDHLLSSAIEVSKRYNISEKTDTIVACVNSAQFDAAEEAVCAVVSRDSLNTPSGAGVANTDNFVCMAIGCNNHITDRVNGHARTWLDKNGFDDKERMSICDTCYTLLNAGATPLKLKNGKTRVPFASMKKRNHTNQVSGADADQHQYSRDEAPVQTEDDSQSRESSQLAFSFSSIESDPQGHLLPSHASVEPTDTATAKAVNTEPGTHWKRSAGRSVHGDVDASRFKRHTPLKTDARRMIGNISQMLVADPARIVEVEQMLKDVQTRDSARRA